MAEITIQLIEDAQRVSARPGDSVRLCLAESPTTGYLWSRTGSLPPKLIEKGSDFRSRTDAIGAAGQRCFLYACEGQFAGELTFVLSRPWAPGEVEKEIRVQFTCAP